MLEYIQSQNIIVQSLIYAAIITLCLPILGWILGQIIEFVTVILSGILGSFLAYFVCNYLTFAGVVHHELAHALFAVITGAQVTEIKLFQPSKYMLGYVNFIPRGGKIRQSFQLVLTAVAPIFCGAISSILLYMYITSHTLVLWQIIICYYLLISIILHMTMSQQDLYSYMKGLPIVYIISSLFIYVLLNYHIF